MLSKASHLPRPLISLHGPIWSVGRSNPDVRSLPSGRASPYSGQMASLVFVLARRGAADAPITVRRALGISPHRGQATDVVRSGDAVVGIATGTGPARATVASDEGWVAAFCGRLDNIDDLAKGMSEEGRGFDAGSPASVLLASFRTHGDEALGRLRGVFEGVVSDGTSAWVVRDQFGFRPLFFHDGPAAFVAATEVKQVVEAAGLSSEPDLDVVDRILFGDFDDATPAAFRGVQRLPKASVLEVGGPTSRIRRYWDPRAVLETSAPDADELAERFDELMRQAVGRTLTGHDVLSLSGGLDSPTIAFFAAPLHRSLAGEPLAALSAVYPDQPEVDESIWIEEVARTFDMPLQTYRRSARPLDGLQDWVRLFDGPVPTLVVNDAKEHYDRAAALGLRTMLTGELAEFLVDQRTFYLAHLLRTGRIGALRGVVAARRSRGSSVRSLAAELTHAFTPRSIESTWIRRRGPARGAGLPAWVDRRRVIEAEIEHVRPARDRWATSQLTALNGPGLTMEADEVCQEVSGVMSRRPWVDVDLFEFFLSLPAEVKYQGARRKDLLRILMRGRVPDSVLDRPTKTLFNASILARIDYEELGRWLVDPPEHLPGFRYDILEERLARQDLSLIEYEWAKDLACAHAFLALW